MHALDIPSCPLSYEMTTELGHKIKGTHVVYNKKN